VIVQAPPAASDKGREAALPRPGEAGPAVR
jgi:hypothetical protein